MGVARQIGEDGLRSGERPLGVDDPLGAAEGRERGVEGALLGERGEFAEEDEASGRMQGCEADEEEPAEQARQHADGEEETRLAGDPARPVQRNAAAGHDDVDVGMMGERRAPGVEHGGEADARARMLRVGGDGGQRLRGGFEQEVVAMISGYMGSSTIFDNAICDFAVDYADQTISDHKAFATAIRDGR